MQSNIMSFPPGTLRSKYWLGGSSEVQILDPKNNYENRQGLKEHKTCQIDGIPPHY